MVWRQETYIDLLHQAYKGSIPTGVFSAIAGTLFTFALWSDVPHELLIPWFIVFSLSQILRIGACVYQNSHFDKKPTSYWHKLFYISVIPSSALWGILPIFAFPYIDEMTRVIISVFLSTAPTAQLLSVVGVFRAWLITTLLLILPLSITWMFYGTSGITLGLIGFLYAVYLYAVGHKSELRLIADEASKSKTTFLATVSHDLRQPLHAITMSLAAAQARLETEKPNKQDLDQAQSSLNMVDRSVESLSQLLNSLLDISKLESGGLKPTFATVHISSLFDYIDKTYRARAHQKGLDFSLISTDLKVHSDPLFLQRIICNLVSNAIRHVPKGRILIGCRRTQSHVKIFVIDNGPGIPAEKFTEIFEEFNQIDNAGRPTNSGYGLGLAISDRLAKALDHELAVLSAPNHGSSFYLEVPLSLEQQDQISLQKAKKGKRTSHLVILIDPNDHILQETAVQIRQWGYRVLAFHTYEEAAKLHIRPHLIIAAQFFPHEISGFQVVNQLRGAWKTKAPAIVTISGFNAEALLDADNYQCHIVPSPPNPTEFKQAIHDRIATD